MKFFTAAALLAAIPFVTAEIDYITTTQSVVSTSYPPPTPTHVMATFTNAAGELVTQAIIYTQSFRPLLSVPSSVKTGSVGLGTIKGSVGTVRTDRFITVTSAT